VNATSVTTAADHKSATTTDHKSVTAADHKSVMATTAAADHKSVTTTAAAHKSVMKKLGLGLVLVWGHEIQPHRTKMGRKRRRVRKLSHMRCVTLIGAHDASRAR
jgi:hypothetical protein